MGRRTSSSSGVTAQPAGDQNRGGPCRSNQRAGLQRPLRATITGTTREQLESALHDIKELWLNRTRVTTVIAEATALYNLAREATALTRYRHPELEPATVAQKLESLLNDSSVPLPAMKVDKSARTLSSASAVGRSCTPEEYWAAMEEA